MFDQLVKVGDAGTSLPIHRLRIDNLDIRWERPMQETPWIAS
jgi:hypothetical protein